MDSSDLISSCSSSFFFSCSNPIIRLISSCSLACVHFSMADQISGRNSNSSEAKIDTSELRAAVVGEEEGREVEEDEVDKDDVPDRLLLVLGAVLITADFKLDSSSI